MEYLQKALEFLTTFEGLGAISLVLEFILRMVPSKKPMSVLYIIADGLQLIGAILGKAGEMLDSVLPQRVKG